MINLTLLIEEKVVFRRVKTIVAFVFSNAFLLALVMAGLIKSGGEYKGRLKDCGEVMISEWWRS